MWSSLTAMLGQAVWQDPGTLGYPYVFSESLKKGTKGNVACRDAVFESGENWFAEARLTGA